VLSDGLAGQKGSKVSQRLERAAKGPRSVDEAVGDALTKSPIDEVDDDTLAEDRQAIANAVAQDKLEKVQSMQERVSKIDKDAAKPGEEGEAGQDKVQQASDVVAAPTTESGISPSDASAPDKPAPDKLGTDKTAADPAGDAAAVSAAGASVNVAAAARERKTDAVIKAQDVALEQTVRAARAETAGKPIVRGYREAEEIGAYDDRHPHSLAV
jgi:hypothetical protein